ncbi:MAG: LexA family transcriptional regulator [Sedimentisphaerales bacterium]|nr:LexA family transcriptional regulator [Sedimentisphaerales bacterium]
MEKFSQKGLIERVIELRKAYAGDRGRSKFASALGISPSTYSYYEKDRIPPIELLLKICRLCNVKIYWLLTGEDEENSDNTQQFGDRFNRAYEKINRICNSNPASLETVIAFLDLLEQTNTIERQMSSNNRLIPDDTKSGWIPVLGRTAAGTVGMWDQVQIADSRIMETELEQLAAKHINSPIIKTQNARISTDLQIKSIVTGLNNPEVNLIQTTQEDRDEIYQFIDCPDIANLYPGCFALQIDGDSMAPRIDDGDVVIVNPSIPAVQGQPAIVRISGAIGVTCKLLRIENDNIHLVPINEKYETKTIQSKDLLWALAVLCHIKLKSVDL